MKAIEEFLKEIESSDVLRNELKAIKDKDAAAAFLKKYDCGATADEFWDALDAAAEGAISDDESEAAAGGSSKYTVKPNDKLHKRGF